MDDISLAAVDMEGLRPSTAHIRELEGSSFSILFPQALKFKPINLTGPCPEQKHSIPTTLAPEHFKPVRFEPKPQASTLALAESLQKLQEPASGRQLIGFEQERDSTSLKDLPPPLGFLPRNGLCCGDADLPVGISAPEVAG